MMAQLGFRPAKMADIEKIREVYNQSRQEVPMHRDLLPEEIETSLFKDNHFTLEDCCWLALVDGQVVGYGFAFAEECRIVAGKSDADISIEVIPENRSMGLQKELMNLAIDFLKSEDIRKARHPCLDTKGWKHDLSLEFSFEDYYHEYSMLWRRGQEPRVFPPPDGIHLEYRMFKEASDDDILEFTEVNNDFYSEKPDFAPELVENWLDYRDELKENDERITFAKEGSKTVGACSCEEWTELNTKEDVKAGYISTLGVVESYRRRGVGRALLTDSMKWLFERGMDSIYLRVDTGNPDALRLYTASDFEIHGENIVYCLVLD